MKQRAWIAAFGVLLCIVYCAGKRAEQKAPEPQQPHFVNGEHNEKYKHKPGEEEREKAEQQERERLAEQERRSREEARAKRREERAKRAEVEEKERISKGLPSRQEELDARREEWLRVRKERKEKEAREKENKEKGTDKTEEKKSAEKKTEVERPAKKTVEKVETAKEAENIVPRQSKDSKKESKDSKKEEVNADPEERKREFPRKDTFKKDDDDAKEGKLGRDFFKKEKSEGEREAPKKDNKREEAKEEREAKRRELPKKDDKEEAKAESDEKKREWSRKREEVKEEVKAEPERKKREILKEEEAKAESEERKREWPRKKEETRGGAKADPEERKREWPRKKEEMKEEVKSEPARTKREIPKEEREAKRRELPKKEEKEEVKAEPEEKKREFPKKEDAASAPQPKKEEPEESREVDLEELVRARNEERRRKKEAMEQLLKDRELIHKDAKSEGQQKEEMQESEEALQEEDKQKESSSEDQEDEKKEETQQEVEEEEQKIPQAQTQCVFDMSEQEIRAALAELKEVHKLLDEYEKTQDKRTLGIVGQKMKDMLPKIKTMSAMKTKSNAELLKELSQGMKDAVGRTKELGRATARTLSGSSVNETPDPVKPEPLEGFLNKQGEAGLLGKSWKKRWFKQRGEKLYYSTSKNEDASSKGYIDLIQMTAVSEAPTSKVKNAFDLTTPSRVYHLQGIEANDLEYWVNGLKSWKKWYEFSQGASKDTSSTSTALPTQQNFARDRHTISGSSLSFSFTSTMDQTSSPLLSSIERNQLPEDNTETGSVPVTPPTPTQTGPVFSSPPAIQEKQVEVSNATPQTIIPPTTTKEPEQNITKEPVLEAQSVESTPERQSEPVVPRKDYTELQEKLKEMELQLKMKDQELEKENERYEDLEKQLRVKERILLSMTNEIQELRNARGAVMEEKQNQTDATEKELQSLKSENVELRVQKDQLTETIESLRQLAKQHEEEARVLEKKLEENRTKMEEQQQTKVTEQFSPKDVSNQNTEDLLEEISQLKQLYWNTLTLGIKLNLLNQGMVCNVDVRSLYDKAQTMDWRKWNGWVLEQYQSSIF